MNSFNVIYTRFSLFNKNILSSWRLGRSEDIQSAKDDLLDHERLKTRCDIFFNYTLPCIDKAFKAGFKINHIVMYYSELPEWIKEKFAEAERKYIWLRPIAKGFEDDIGEYAEIKSAVRIAAKDCSVNFLPIAGIRLDDDDVLGVNFFKQLNLYLKPEFQGFCISFPKGVVALWEDEFVKFSPYYQEKVTMGLSQISLFDVENSKFVNQFLMPPGAHVSVDKRVPTILDGRSGPLYIRTYHSNNDELYGRSSSVTSSYINDLFKEEISFSPINDLG